MARARCPWNTSMLFVPADLSVDLLALDSMRLGSQPLGYLLALDSAWLGSQPLGSRPLRSKPRGAEEKPSHTSQRCSELRAPKSTVWRVSSPQLHQHNARPHSVARARCQTQASPITACMRSPARCARALTCKRVSLVIPCGRDITNTEACVILAVECVCKSSVFCLLLRAS